MKATIVFDPMFGDGGKGAAVDYLARQNPDESKMVVRYNGGAQAAHRVVDEHGEHVFGMFGSGTFANLDTFLSEFVRVDPHYLMIEANELMRDLGENNPLDYVTIDPNALLVTPYHVEFSQKQALSSTKGTTGMGVGESGRYAARNPETSLYAKDLLDQKLMREKLWEQMHDYRSHIDPNTIAQHWAMLGSKIHLKTWLELRGEKTGGYHFIFEGSGGHWLDPLVGFKPHVTSTRTTIANALDMVHNPFSPESVNVIATTSIFAQRHGPGNFPTEESRLKPFLPVDQIEGIPGQGAVRVGWFDAELVHSATRYNQTNELHITHADYFDRIPLWNIKREAGWKYGIGDLKHYLETIEQHTGLPVTVVGFGPSAEDRKLRSEL